MTATGRLRAADGLPAATVELQRLVPYLRVTIGEPDGDDWYRCADLHADPAALGALLRTCGAGRGTDDPVVAASLFAQAYAFRVAGTAATVWLLTGLTPSLDPATTWFALARSRPSSVAWAEETVGTDDDDDGGALQAQIGMHLGAFFGAVRATVDIGERLLVGNAVTAVAVAARALHEALPEADRPALRRRTETWLASLGDPLTGLGAFVTLTEGGRTGWFWERTNCCLNDKIEGAPRCGDCSKTPEAERHTAFRASLI